MAKPESKKKVITLEEVVLAQAFEFEALISVLERHGVITRDEVTAEIKRLNEKAGTVKWPSRIARGAPQGSSFPSPKTGANLSFHQRQEPKCGHFTLSASATDLIQQFDLANLPT